MKIGYYCESPADQAAMSIFAEGILGEQAQPISMELEAHSVPAIFDALDGVLRGVHYNSDADGLIVVVDCDYTYRTASPTRHQGATKKSAGSVRSARSSPRHEISSSRGRAGQN
jgi:hypothetical protein